MRLETGYVLHSRTSKWFGKIIRLSTAIGAVFSGEWVPNHTAVIVRDDGIVWVYESTSFKGAHRVPIERWIVDHPDFKITPVDIRGRKEKFKEFLNSMLGVEYEPWWSLILVPFNRATTSLKRLFCTEYVVAAFAYITAPCVRGLIPSKTDPPEFYDRLK